MSASLPLLADEPHHVAQVHLFMRGEWKLTPTLTTVPGYHALLAGAGLLVGKGDVTFLRLCSFMLSVATLATLFALARDARDGRATERVLQVAFLPILFPLFFLVYTDVAAVLAFSLALLLQARRHYWLAGVAAAMTLAIRQNHIVWVGFAALLLAIDVALAHVSNDASSNNRAVGIARTVLTRRPLVELGKRAAAYAVGLALFVAFLVWNRGIAIGDRAMHPFPTIHLGNIYFALFLCFFLFLPLHLANWRQIVSLARRPTAVVTLAGFLLLFLATFRVDHPYNQPELSWWLHNALLTFLVSSVWTKLLMFGPMALAALSLSVTRLRKREYCLVYPFAVVSLLPAWQIEQRYYLIPLILLLLFRVQRSPRLEWSLIAYVAVCTGILFFGITTGAFFL